MVGVSSPVTYATLKLTYPIFDAEFDPYNRGYLVVAGGGGENRTGVPNKITLLDVSSRESISQLAETDLSTDEDSPQSIASLTTKKGLITFAGVSSSIANQKRGNNEHFRCYNVEFPARKRVKRDEDSQDAVPEKEAEAGITFAGSSSLFKPPTPQKSKVYQRLLRLSPIKSRERAAKRIGAIAAADAAENEIIVFDATTFLPKQSSILARLDTGLEAEDLDLFEHSEGSFGLAYCTNHDAVLHSVTCDFSSKTSDVSKDPQTIYSTPGRGPARPRLRSLRWISPRHLVLLQNFPQGKGAEILVVQFDSEEGSVVRRHRLPNSIGVAIRLDVCCLDPDPTTSKRQVVIAVAGQNKSIHLFTCNHEPSQKDPTRRISKLRSFSVLNTSRQHPQSISKIVFSNFFPPSQPEKSNLSVASETQYIYLASVSLGYTVSVEAIALSAIPTPPSSTPDVPAKKTKSPSVRWVLSTTENEILSSPYLYWIVAIFMGIVGYLLMNYMAQTLESARNESILKTGSIASQRTNFDTVENVVATAKIPPDQTRGTEDMQETQSSKLDRPLKEYIHLHREHLEPTHDDQAAAGGSKKVVHVTPDSDNPFSKDIAAVLHEDEDKLRAAGAKKFEELDPDEKEAWKEKLSAAGRWSAEEGETVLKGVFFSEFANVVGGAIRDAILQQ